MKLEEILAFCQAHKGDGDDWIEEIANPLLNLSDTELLDFSKRLSPETEDLRFVVGNMVAFDLAGRGYYVQALNLALTTGNYIDTICERIVTGDPHMFRKLNLNASQLHALASTDVSMNKYMEVIANGFSQLSANISEIHEAGISQRKELVAQANPATVPRPTSKPLEQITDTSFSWEEPKSIVAYLDQYVIGQEEAKRVIAVAFSNYITKAITKSEGVFKQNALLIGPSGVGKTYLISLLASKASLPFVQTKLTGKTTEGYKGENVSAVFEQIREATAEQAPYGVVFFDEIDKLARDNWGSGFGGKIQDELIGWAEEATILGDNNKSNKKGGNHGLNTRNLLFVTAGAFQDTDATTSLAGIIQRRLGYGNKQIGFGGEQSSPSSPDDHLLRKVRPQDLITYGLKPELVGRFPSLAVFDSLTLQDKERILTTAKRSAITNYSELLTLKGYRVHIDSAVPRIIAESCPQETGARALAAVCNSLFTDIMFDPQRYADRNKVITVTPDLARRLISVYA